MTKLDEAWSGLEPHCAEIAKAARDIPAANQLLLLSAATSLKRIADFLTGDPEEFAVIGEHIFNPKNNLSNMLADRFNDLIHDLKL